MLKMFKFYILLSLLLLFGQIDAETTSRIFGGVEVTSNSSPNYQVAVLGPIFMGSGSLIRQNFVLTAASCIFGISPADIQIRVGSVQYYEGGIEALVELTVIHPKYTSSNRDFNAAVIKLTEGLDAAEMSALNIVPIPLASNFPGIGAPGFLTGYGVENTDSALPHFLKMVRLEILPKSECIKRNAPYFEPEMFCAGFSDNSRDACNYDEGGPFMNGGEQIGIYSHGGKCGAIPKGGAIFVNVPQTRSWILYAVTTN